MKKILLDLFLVNRLITDNNQFVHTKIIPDTVDWGTLPSHNINSTVL
jgi:hypothetical protein